MSTFPAIVPASRLYITGDFPNTIQISASGSATGFRRGNRRINETLQLGFLSLTETQVNLIRSHFDSQSGSFQVFYLTSTTWSGYTNSPVPLLSDVGWLYSSPPIISDSELLSRWDVDVELESVPINLGDLIFDGGDSSTTARAYILDALTSSASPARQNIIDSKGSEQP